MFDAGMLNIHQCWNVLAHVLSISKWVFGTFARKFNALLGASINYDIPVFYFIKMHYHDIT